MSPRRVVSPAVSVGLAVSVAVVSVVAAVAILVHSPVDSDATPPTVSSADHSGPGSSGAPSTTEPAEPRVTPMWALDAREVYGRDFAAFRSPAAGLQYDSSSYGLIDGGSVVVTAIGLPDPRGYTLDDVRLTGIDSESGQVRWSVAPGSLDTCASRPAGDEVVCLDSYADIPAVVAIGLRDGAIRRISLPDGWFPFGLESDGDVVYVLEGNPEDSESILHGGSLDDLGSAWSMPVEAFAPWEGVEETLIHVDGGRGLITLGGDEQFFDPRTGKMLDGLALEDDATVVDTRSGDEDGHSSIRSLKRPVTETPPIRRVTT